MGDEEMTHTHTYIHTYTYTYTYTHTHTHTHTHNHNHTHTHTYTHTYIHTYTHTHTHSARPLSRTATFANEQRKLERIRFQAAHAAVLCAIARASANRRTGGGHKHACTSREKSNAPLNPTQKEECQASMIEAMRCQRAGDRAGEGIAYGSLGNALDDLGQHDKAIEFHTKDLNISRGIGDRAGEGTAYGNLGAAFYGLHQFDKAIKFHTKHLNIFRGIGDRQRLWQLGCCL